MKKGDWITNNPRGIKAWFPRRACKVVEGEPRPSQQYGTEYLKSRGIVGIYLDEEIDCDYKELPLIRTYKELQHHVTKTKKNN